MDGYPDWYHPGEEYRRQYTYGGREGDGMKRRGWVTCMILFVLMVVLPVVLGLLVHAGFFALLSLALIPGVPLAIVVFTNRDSRKDR